MLRLQYGKEQNCCDTYKQQYTKYWRKEKHSKCSGNYRQNEKYWGIEKHPLSFWKYLSPEQTIAVFSGIFEESGAVDKPISSSYFLRKLLF